MTQAAKKPSRRAREPFRIDLPNRRPVLGWTDFDYRRGWYIDLGHEGLAKAPAPGSRHITFHWRDRHSVSWRATLDETKDFVRRSFVHVDFHRRKAAKRDGTEWDVHDYAVGLLVADFDQLPASHIDYAKLRADLTTRYPHAVVLPSKSGKAKVFFLVEWAIQPLPVIERALRCILDDEILFEACDKQFTAMTTSDFTREMVQGFAAQKHKLINQGPVSFIAQWPTTVPIVEPVAVFAAEPTDFFTGLLPPSLLALSKRKKFAQRCEQVVRIICGRVSTHGVRLRLSQPKLAELTGYPLSAVNEIMARLVKEGWLSPDYDQGVYAVGKYAMSYWVSSHLVEDCLVPQGLVPAPTAVARTLPPPPGSKGWDEYAFKAVHVFYDDLDGLLRHACTLPGVFDERDRLAKFVWKWRSWAKKRGQHVSVNVSKIVASLRQVTLDGELIRVVEGALSKEVA